MDKQLDLCSKCIAIFKDSFQIRELSGRKKITCEHCGKRSYGALCVVQKERK